MAQHEEIIVWLDRRWKEAIEHHLKDETIQERLENVLDELCNQLPKREYARISRELWEEDRMARKEAEAARTYSAYRVVEGGEEHYFRMTPGEELLGAAQTLRKYLKDTRPQHRQIHRSIFAGAAYHAGGVSDHDASPHGEHWKSHRCV